MTAPFFSAAQCARVDALRQEERTIHTKRREAVRRCLEAGSGIGRGGAQWRLLPTEYGKWHSVYTRCARWADLGVWGRLFARVAGDPDRQRVRIDATVLRAHAGAAGAPTTTAGAPRGRAGARAAGSARSAVCWSTRGATRWR